MVDFSDLMFLAVCYAGGAYDKYAFGGTIMNSGMDVAIWKTKCVRHRATTISNNLKCKSERVIYAISCLKCNAI